MYGLMWAMTAPLIGNLPNEWNRCTWAFFTVWPAISAMLIENVLWHRSFGAQLLVVTSLAGIVVGLLQHVVPLDLPALLLLYFLAVFVPVYMTWILQRLLVCEKQSVLRLVASLALMYITGFLLIISEHATRGWPTSHDLGEALKIATEAVPLGLMVYFLAPARGPVLVNHSPVK